jgi:hypothetical protein
MTPESILQRVTMLLVALAFSIGAMAQEKPRAAKNIGRRKYQRGSTRRPQAWGVCPTPWARPYGLWATWQASGAHPLLYDVF